MARPFLESGIGGVLLSKVLSFLDYPYAGWVLGVASLLLVIAMLIVAVAEYQGRQEQRGYRERTRQLVNPAGVPT
ncbi:hypothetical protein [Halorarum salinum]|uniref:Uncharacterized protein n=1 Tax=Halorarum salinum TaxID=2743089 RepID=A0A7D5LAQ2_9EURY|nr:hypothetical protein [Halobaculum salinum]QLG62007.1 hypothetical protein HUG12_09840 [Halobaculum salinum]